MPTNEEFEENLNQVPRLTVFYMFLESSVMNNVGEYPNKDWALSLIYKSLKREREGREREGSAE